MGGLWLEDGVVGNWLPADLEPCHISIKNVSIVAPFAGLHSNGARPAITSWYSPSVYSMCSFRTAPRLRSARAASGSLWNGRSVGLCHEQ
jgi:hypothetical protein